MPTYDYRCEANGQVLEVSHSMRETLRTWGELCERAGADPGDTPLDSPVQRLATGGNLISSENLGSGSAPPTCGAGGCGTGMCGLG